MLDFVNNDIMFLMRILMNMRNSVTKVVVIEAIKLPLLNLLITLK